jgi:hypothetical protein
MSKQRIVIFGNSHVSIFSGQDRIIDQKSFPEVYESEHFIYLPMRLGPSTAYNFFWNPNYYPRVVQVLEKGNYRNDYICLLIGELDCRTHIGINSEKSGRPLEDCIEEVVDRMNMCLLDLKKRGYKVLVINVQPGSTYPPNEDPQSPVYGLYEFRNKLTIQFNSLLKHKSKIHGYLYCDIFDELMIDTYFPNMCYFMDYVHLRGSLVRPMFDEALKKLLL